MTFVITTPCIDTKDQSCVDVCPVDCIHFEGDNDRMLYINPTDCIDCGACQPACPVSAIFPEGEVPEAESKFIEINELWYDDPAAARAKVGGGAAPAATEEAPAAEEAPAETSVAESPAAAPDPDATPAEAAAETGEAEPKQTPAAPEPEPEPEPEPVAAYSQVPATAAGAAMAPSHALPSPLGFVAIAVFSVLFYLMWVFPGPQWITIGGLGIGATVIALLPVALVVAFVFLVSQVREFSGFAAKHERAVGKWRLRRAELRRSEESRRYNLTRTVQAIAETRFPYPNEQYPDLKAYVNLPEPEMAIELAGSGEKLFPDIVMVRQPGNRPVGVAQVETRETVTREQAQYVWARLENEDAPLYLYVPAGLLSRTRDYVRAAGIKNVRFRTWRWTPNGMLVREM